MRNDQLISQKDVNLIEEQTLLSMTRKRMAINRLIDRWTVGLTHRLIIDWIYQLS